MSACCCGGDAFRRRAGALADTVARSIVGAAAVAGRCADGVIGVPVFISLMRHDERAGRPKGIPAQRDGAQRQGCMHDRAGRSKREFPLGGTVRSAKGAHMSAPDRPNREIPPGGTARSAKGACTIAPGRSRHEPLAQRSKSAS